MGRNILTLAALSLALSAIGIAPLRAQATSEQSLPTQVLVDASVLNSVDITGGATGPVHFGPFDPETGADTTYGFNIVYNGAGYKVTFVTSNTANGAFNLNNGAHLIPYTIKDANGESANNTYADTVQGTTLTDAAPSFLFHIDPITVSSATLPYGTYSDHLTVTVTAV
jgi:hypothetical protein